MVRQALILLIRVYQLTLSPLLGPCCRFEPSCSRYAAQCIEIHGVLRGTWLALRRLSHCHPFHPGGYDPPPLPPEHEARQSAQLPAACGNPAAHERRSVAGARLSPVGSGPGAPN